MEHQDIVLNRMSNILSNIFNLIYEMAFSRSNAESKITSLGIQVLLHLIKILKWNDIINYNKHIADINSWIFQIQIIKIKPRNKRFNSNQYYEFMFHEHIEQLSDLDNMIKFGLQHYHNLPVLKTNDKLFENLKIIYTNLSNDISENKFKGIEYYLQ